MFFKVLKAFQYKRPVNSYCFKTENSETGELTITTDTITPLLLSE